MQMPALDERGQRLAQRRARDAELLAQLALRRQARARRQQAELDRGAESLERLLECGLAPDRREDDGKSVSPFSRRKLLLTVDVTYSRSNPLTRSQSVTAASNAFSSTRAAFK
jgi:hypothetical protein